MQGTTGILRAEPARPPGSRTGLQVPSQVMTDKIVSVPRTAVTRTIGRCDTDELESVGNAVRRWLDL